jgi:hypothetical protein
MHRLLGVVADAFTDEILDDENWMAEQLRGIESLDRTDAERTARQLKSLVKAGHIRPVVKQEASMKMLFAAVEDSANGFMAMEWMVFAAPEPSFFTSDIPVYVSPSGPQNHDIGIATEGNVVHVPLSSRRFLLMGGLGRRNAGLAALRGVASHAFVNALQSLPPVVSHMRASPEIIQKLNEATAVLSGDWVCGPHGSEVMTQALLKPRIKSDYHVSRIGGEMKVRHRFIVEKGLTRRVAQTVSGCPSHSRTLRMSGLCHIRDGSGSQSQSNP